MVICESIGSWMFYACAKNFLERVNICIVNLSKNYNIRTYRVGDELGILTLLKTAFLDWAEREAALEYWKWKYLETPLGTAIFVAEYEGKIIGVTHNIFLRLKIGSSFLLTQCSCDASTHQDYRGSGVFGRIVEEVEKNRLEKNVKLGYGISSNPTVINEWGKRGRVPFPHHISYMARIKDVDLYLKIRPMENAKFVGVGYKTLTNLNKIRHNLKRTNAKKDFDIVEINHFTESADTFWVEINKYYDFMPDKSSRFLNWRYCMFMGSKLFMKQATKDGIVLGYIVYELRKNGEYYEGFILDLLALPERLDVVDALLRDSCSFFDYLGVNVIYYLVVKGHPYQSVSTEQGFLDSRKTPYITFQIIDAEKEFELLKTSSPSRVYFSYCNML